MRQVLRQPYWVCRDRLPKEACEQIIEIGKELNIRDGGVFGAAENDKILNQKYRKTNVGFVPKGHSIETILHSHVSLANLDSGWNFRVTDKELAQFAEYKTGHFYDWHKDVPLNPNVPHRKLSITVNLSDSKDYEGGDLELKNYWGNQTLKMPIDLRRQGTIVVFPSMLLHRVTKIKRGTRYSLVQWFSGPEFT